jgi:hypothetical protein
VTLSLFATLVLGVLVVEKDPHDGTRTSAAIARAEAAPAGSWRNLGEVPIADSAGACKL